MPNPYEIKAKGNGEADLLVYGDIGESWYGDSVTAKAVVEQLQALDVTTINVRINSYGGSVSDGLAIYNALRNHKAEIKVRIEGVAVSIASLIAMAGDTVEMADNALFMVHAPWGYASGNAAALREYADVLDTFAKAMASSYVKKTGKTNDAILSLLTDGEDHWYTAAEAKAEGFVDEITAELAAAASGFAGSRFMIQAAIAAGKRIEQPVSQPAAPVAAINPEEAIMPNPQNPATPEPVAKSHEQIQAEALAANASRVAGIRAVFKPFEGRDGVSALLNICIDDHTISADVASAKLLAKLGEGAEPLAGSPRISLGEDERDKINTAAMNALLVRAGVHRMKGNGHEARAIDLQGNPFVGATLLDLAKAALQRAGKNPSGMDKREVVAAAFQTTSDFPVLLENTVHKILQAAYMTAPDTWSRFCAIGTVSDFRAHPRYRTGSIGNLDSLNERGEYKTKTIPDAEKGSITAGTKGNIIGITREVIINDDLQALVSMAVMLARAGKRTIEADVYALLALNGGLGPAMLDSKTLFHADHGNIGTAAAISMAAIDADRVLMAKQKDVGGNDYLDLRPTKLLVPVELGGTARTINDALYDPDTANKLQKPNMVNGLFDDIIDSPRLSGTRRYLFADPNEAPVIEVAFLDGVQEPFVETRNGWTSDGAELKVRLDFGIAAVDYRGAETNAGA